MKGLREKLQNKKGFTLIEMLIVVAIIAILIAISIPLIGQALEKARDATDQANERSAKATAVLKYLNIETDLTNPGATGHYGTFYYDAVNGKLVDATAAASIAAYGKCKGDTGCYQTKSHESAIIKAVIGDTGEVTISWVTASTLADLP